MAKKSSPTTVPGANIDVEALAQAEGVEEYRDSDFAERQSQRPVRDYVIEEDPILAEGDHRVHVPPPPAPAVELASDSDPVSRLAATLEKFAARPAGSMDGAMMERLVAVLEKVVLGQQAGTAAATEAVLKGKDPSNMNAPGFSAFNPRGEHLHPRPMLNCRVFLPWEAERESLTREEIELINLLEPGDFIIKRNDESRIKITIKGEANVNVPGRWDRMLMNSETGFNNDYAYLMPPLRSMLRQILGQRPHTKAAAAEVMTMDEELDLISHHGVDYDAVVASEA